MQNGNGFTLIKLLVVVVVIGSLAAFAIPTVGNRREKAEVAGMQADLRTLVTAQDAFYRDNQTYATAIGSTQGATTVAFEPGANNVITLVRELGRLGRRGDQPRAQGRPHHLRHLHRERHGPQRRGDG